MSIEGPSTGKTGSLLTYRCLASNANPAPDISWVLNGKSVEGVDLEKEPSSSSGAGLGGWDVASELRTEVAEGDSVMAITCSARSRGHHGDQMSEKAEKQVLVLSK